MLYTSYTSIITWNSPGTPKFHPPVIGWSSLRCSSTVSTYLTSVPVEASHPATLSIDSLPHVLYYRHFVGQFWAVVTESGFPCRRSEVQIPAESNPWLAQFIHDNSLDWYLALQGYGRDWLSQYWDNVTEWEITVLVVSWYGSTIKPPWVRTITSQCPNLYDCRCCDGV